MIDPGQKVFGSGRFQAYENGVADQTTSAPAPPKATASDDDKWHFVIAPYLWFPGISGTVGTSLDASVHASATDVVGYFNIGVMGAVEARRNRLIVPVDFVWVRLGDNKLELGFVPGSNRATTRKVTESTLTPKVGYRFADTERWKADALFGIRYWHLVQTITLKPYGLSTSPSVNWVDYNLGLRVTAALTPKMAITAFADEGAGGSRLDYQASGLLGYKIKPTIALFIGWRYLYVDYRNRGDKRFIYDAHQSGPLAGLTWDVK